MFTTSHQFVKHLFALVFFFGLAACSGTQVQTVSVIESPLPSPIATQPPLPAPTVLAATPPQELTNMRFEEDTLRSIDHMGEFYQFFEDTRELPDEEKLEVYKKTPANSNDAKHKCLCPNYLDINFS